MTAGRAVYVYAVVRDAVELPADLVGVDGGAVRPVDGADGLRAVVSEVERAAFEARALEERLEDLEWLAATARAHHAVVDAVGRRGPVAPLSLATVYFDDARVRDVLAAGASTFTRVIDHVTGRAEWGVKAFAVPRAAGPTRGATSGADYLRRRRQALRERDTSLDEATRAAEEVHGAVAEIAVDARRHRAQDGSLTGATDPMVLNGAYLVRDEDADRVAEAVAASADPARIRVEITGPWVPYSFSQPGER